MGTASIAGRLRSVTALAAAAALLGLSACSPDAEDGSEETAPAPTTSSDGGGAQETTPQETDEGTASQDEGTDGQDETDGDEETSSAAGERTRIMLRIDLGVDETGGEGAPTLAGDDLAALLAEPFGGEAECADALELAPGAAPVGCTGPTSFDDTAPAQNWTANVAMVPSEAGFDSGTQVAVLFTTGTALPEDAEELLDEDVALTGVGFGSAFGMEPLSAEQVAESTLQTLTSEFAYVRVDQDADWSEVTCEDGLDFTRFETVDCEATTADGTSWDLVVAPGTYADNDQGLLVGIDRTSGG